MTTIPRAEAIDILNLDTLGTLTVVLRCYREASMNSYSIVYDKISFVRHDASS